MDKLLCAAQHLRKGGTVMSGVRDSESVPAADAAYDERGGHRQVAWRRVP
ncbi:MAG: hypothetical protein ABSH14_03220 [Verrucomicrobiia bacterium]